MRNPRLARLAVLAALPVLLSGSVPALAGTTGAVQGEVLLKQRGGKPKKDRSGVVVYLEGVPAPAQQVVKPGQPVRQREAQFLPRVVAVQRGAQVDFPNEDKIFHNVFSLSQAAKFDLGLYKSGTAKSVTFDRAGTVDVYCNIHPEMVATVKVVDTPYFAVTDRDGKFRIADVPAGTYPVVGWQARGEAWRGTVTVAASGSAELRFELTEGEDAPTHSRKDGTPYGRYE